MKKIAIIVGVVALIVILVTLFSDNDANLLNAVWNTIVNSIPGLSADTDPFQ